MNEMLPSTKSPANTPLPAAGDEISWADLVHWIEFAAWVTLALTPFLYYVNGPAVSRDQWVMRSALITLAGIIACASVLRRLRPRRSACPEATSPAPSSALPSE